MPFKKGTLISHGGLKGRIRRADPRNPGWWYCEIYGAGIVWRIHENYLVERESDVTVRKVRQGVRSTQGKARLD